VGLINDDETDVGRVHLGIVHIFTVQRPRVEPREAEMHDAGFQPLAELRQLRDSMESWSQICLDALYPEEYDDLARLP
jgi:predicted NUDIX family phosphoesterase